MLNERENEYKRREEKNMSAKKIDYASFIDKFKEKKTTDDCYTPIPIYEIVLNWVRERYGINAKDVIRPFYPGGDYKKCSYDKKIVVDNPPFSIISEIVNYYLDHDIPFFLFAPALTLFSPASDRFEQFCHIGTNVTITYENGAKISTSFLTNLDENVILTAPDLYKLIIKANAGEIKRTLPKYQYPTNLIRSSDLGKLSKNGVDYRLTRNQVKFIRQLDSQRPKKKTIFGGGVLTSKPLVHVDEKVITWKLSEKEKQIIERMSKS